MKLKFVVQERQTKDIASLDSLMLPQLKLNIE